MTSQYRTLILDSLKDGPKSITEMASSYPLPNNRDIRGFRVNLRAYAGRMARENIIEAVPSGGKKGTVVWRMKADD